jgi:hypothetical protein
MLSPLIVMKHIVMKHWQNDNVFPVDAITCNG